MAAYTHTPPRWSLRLAVAAGVVLVATAVAVQGLPDWEESLFRTIHSLPDWLEPVLWAAHAARRGVRPGPRGGRVVGRVGTMAADAWAPSSPGSPRGGSPRWSRPPSIGVGRTPSSPTSCNGPGRPTTVSASCPVTPPWPSRWRRCCRRTSRAAVARRGVRAGGRGRLRAGAPRRPLPPGRGRGGRARLRVGMALEPGGRRPGRRAGATSVELRVLQIDELRVRHDLPELGHHRLELLGHARPSRRPAPRPRS